MSLDVFYLSRCFYLSFLLKPDRYLGGYFHDGFKLVDDNNGGGQEQCFHWQGIIYMKETGML